LGGATDPRVILVGFDLRRSRRPPLIEEVEYLTKFFSDLSQRWTLIIDECGNRRSAVGCARGLTKSGAREGGGL